MLWLGVGGFAMQGASTAFADAAADLVQGQKALAGGDFDQALKLLSAAAQNLPESVEARLALAECRLKMGQLDSAAEQYRTVLKLSPDHPVAKRVLEGLAGQTQTAAQQLALTRMLYELGAWEPAENLARKLVQQSATDEAVRNETRLLLVQTRLFAGNIPGAIEEAGRGISGPTAGSMRLLTALALAAKDEPDYERAAALLKDLPDPKDATDQKRLALVQTLLDLQDPTKYAAVSSKLREQFTILPTSPLRHALVQRVSRALLQQAVTAARRGERDTAVGIAWPMISDAPLPKADAVLKPLTFKGGWLSSPTELNAAKNQIVLTFSTSGYQEFLRLGAKATLLDEWIAVELLRQNHEATNKSEKLVVFIEQLSGLSRAAEQHLPGTSLSVGDEMQLLLIRETLPQLTNVQLANRLVAALAAQAERYKQVRDLATFVDKAIPPAANAELKAGQNVTLAEGLNRLPPYESRKALLTTLAKLAEQLGNEEFAKAAAAQDPKANEALNRYDLLALHLHGMAAGPAQPILDRYIQTDRWVAALDGAIRYHSMQSLLAGRWAVVRIKLARAAHIEQRLIAQNRQLAKELSADVKEALVDAMAILREQPTAAHREMVLGLAEPLLQRYGSINRADLTEAIIAVVTVPAPAKTPAVADLADWGSWIKIVQLERAALRKLAVAAQQSGDRTQLPLSAEHKAILQELAQFAAKYPQSTYLHAALNRAAEIPTLYQHYAAYGAVDEALVIFLTAHPDRAFTPRFEVLRGQMLLMHGKVQLAKQREKDPQVPPQLLPRFETAFKFWIEVAQKRTTGDIRERLEIEFLDVARLYGSAGSWDVSRVILDRLTAALPDDRDPLRLKLYRAATHIGELDLAAGLALLSVPAPQKESTADDKAATALAYSTAKNPIGKFDALSSDIVTATIDDGKQGDKFAAQTAGTIANGGAGGAGFGGGLNGQIGSGPAGAPGIPGASQPNSGDLAMAAIRNAEQNRIMQVAMLEDGEIKPPQDQQQTEVVLPTGPVLSEAALKKQDAASDQAYAILLEIMQDPTAQDRPIVHQARRQIDWLFSFFENQQRANRAVAMIQEFLKDQPVDAARVALGYRAILDQLTWAARRQPTERVNKTWIDQRHTLFETARADLRQFLKDNAERREWLQKSQLLVAGTFEREAQLASAVSPVRASGLLLQATESLRALVRENPEHPAAPQIPERFWQLAERLVALHQEEQAIFVLNQLPREFPAHARANEALLRVANLSATNLNRPLRAVEVYQEYLGLVGDNETIRTQIFQIAEQLAAKQRFLEALHVYGVFVDSFPGDPRAAQALLAIGQTHQSNEAWNDAIKSYQRILAEFPAAPVTPQVKLAVAECHINLSHWREARKQYDEFLAQHPQDGQIELAKQRIEVLKNLDRYQTLLADDQVQRNKDDAQYQIAIIVKEKLGNHVKAIAEFRKVIAAYATSPLADDAQLEIGKGLLQLAKLDEARAELLNVPKNYPGSPLADDALFLVGQSYEQAAQRLAAVTGEKAKAEAFERGQRGAYRAFNEGLAKQQQSLALRRDELKKSGSSKDLDLDEAASAFRENTANLDSIAFGSRAAELQSETESALQVANRQDKINDAYRQAVISYTKAATDFPLGDMTDDALLRMAQIFESQLKDRTAAIETYAKIVKFFPGTPVAEDAAWKTAEFHEEEGKYAEAVAAYREFIRNYPASARVADAQYALAEALEQLGRWVEAMDAYETFRQKFNAHPKAQMAAEQINWIKAYRK